MKCLYCDSNISRYTLKSFLLKDDLLCGDCRRKLKVNKKIIEINKIRIETYFEYESIYKDLLIQYKECYDEALADVFLYDLKEYLEIKYFGYTLVFVPSSNLKLNERGFNHLEKMFDTVKLNKSNAINIKQDIIQQGKTKEERKEIIDNYYYVGGYIKKALLVDDVVTTGSSLLASYKAIKPYCGSIKTLALARAK